MKNKGDGQNIPMSKGIHFFPPITFSSNLTHKNVNWVYKRNISLYKVVSEGF